MITGKILGDRYVKNGVPTDTEDFVPDMSAEIYYEVVRLIDGKILFLQDHLERLRQSLSGSPMKFPGKPWILKNLGLLIKENTIREGNIRICLYQLQEGNQELQCYFIPYFYPDSDMYRKGVRLHIYPHIRPNPGVKKWDDLFRNSVSSYILNNQIYEVALKNHQNQITEGSRSNIFFIDHTDSLITAPGEIVLQGITRKYVLDLARNEGVRIRERTIPVKELDSMVSVFLTGTSPKVLPVKQIDGSFYDVNHPLLRRLMTQFDGLVRAKLQPI